MAVKVITYSGRGLQTYDELLSISLLDYFLETAPFVIEHEIIA